MAASRTASAKPPYVIQIRRRMPKRKNIYRQDISLDNMFTAKYDYTK